MSSSFKLQEDRASRGWAAEKVEQWNSLSENWGLSVRSCTHAPGQVGVSVGLAAVWIWNPPAPSPLHGALLVPPRRERFRDLHMALYHLSGHLERPAP